MKGLNGRNLPGCREAFNETSCAVNVNIIVMPFSRFCLFSRLVEWKLLWILHMVVKLACEVAARCSGTKEGALFPLPTLLAFCGSR